MASLLSKFREILVNKSGNGESYTKQHLKRRLEKHFKNEIVFCQPSDRSKSEIVFSSSIKVQDVLNAWAENKAVHENKADGKGSETVTPGDIFKVAKHIKKKR